MVSTIVCTNKRRNLIMAEEKGKENGLEQDRL